MTTLCDVMRSLGEPRFGEMLRAVSMSRLKTYQIFEQIKVRTHLTKLNSEHLRKASPRLWARLEAGDQELAADISQAILVSHLEMIIAALDLLGIPHNDGFFSKDADVASHLAEGWQQRVYDALKDKHPPAVLAFYINHLAVETVKSESIFIPAAS